MTDVFVFLVDSSTKRLLLLRNPDGFDPLFTPIFGPVRTHETSEQAAERRIEESVGLKGVPVQLRASITTGPLVTHGYYADVGPRLNEAKQQERQKVQFHGYDVSREPVSPFIRYVAPMILNDNWTEVYTEGGPAVRNTEGGSANG